MKHVLLKRTFALALLVPVLGLITVALRPTPDAPSAATPSVQEDQAPPAAAETNHAIRQLQQQGTYASLQDAVRAARMHAEPVHSLPAGVSPASHVMSAPWRGVRGYFGADGLQVRPTRSGGQPWAWNARLVSYGYGEIQTAAAPVEPIAQGRMIEYRRGALTEWYLNDQRGLEQGFTLSAPPDGPLTPAGPLTLNVKVDTELKPQLNRNADSVAFCGEAGEPVLHYAGLLAWDARGRHLPARIELRAEGALALLVDDRAAVYPVTVDPLIFVETKLTAPDATASDVFGSGVAISGDTVVVGAQFDDVPGADHAGTAYVFVRNGAAWEFQQKLSASDARAFDTFGNNVAISGDTIVVGAVAGRTETQITDGTSNTIIFSELIDSGAAYVFTRTGGVWTQQQKLTPYDAAQFDQFGIRVAVNGDTIAVGSRGTGSATIDGTGAAYVFTRSGSTWSLQQKLVPDDAAAGDSFGISLAFDGDTLVAGAEHHGGAGAAYVFVRNSGVWTQQQKLTGSAAVAQDRFGFSVDISGNTAVVGAFFDDTPAGVDAGSAYVFVRTGTQWNEQQMLLPADGGADQVFALSAAIDGETIVIGAPGSDLPSGSKAGAAYVFVRDGSVWSQAKKLTASDGSADDRFAQTVDISGETVVAAAPGDDTDAGLRTGSVYVYDNATTADLLVGLGADKTNVKSNDTITYTITVRNFGPNRAVNVAVDDVLPSGTVFQHATANRGNFTAPPPNQTGVVTWYLGDMVDGDEESAQLVVTVTVKGKGSLLNTATVRSDTFDSNPLNNTATLVTTVGAGGGGGNGKK